MIEASFNGKHGKLNFVTVPCPEPSAPPLLMLHGVTRRWQTFQPLFASLAVRRKIVALDFPGHGKSSESESGYLVTDYAEDAIEFASRNFDAPFMLYGHSLGAMVAAQVAAELGDQVVGVVLEDPPLHTMGDRLAQLALMDLFRAMHRVAQAKNASISEQVATLADAQLVDPQTGAATRLGDVRDQVALRFMASCLRPLDPRVLEPIVASQWLEGYNTAAIFEGIERPVLLLQGDPDCGGMLIDEDAGRLEKWAADLTRVRLSGCSHLVHWDRTAMLLNYVHTFLETVDR